MFEASLFWMEVMDKRKIVFLDFSPLSRCFTKVATSFKSYWKHSKNNNVKKISALVWVLSATSDTVSSIQMSNTAKMYHSWSSLPDRSLIIINNYNIYL